MLSHKIIALTTVFAAFSSVATAQAEFNLSILDLTILQDGDSLTINEAPSDWPLSYSITAKPGPLSIILPLGGCRAEEEGTFVRVYDFGVARDLVAGLVAVRDTSRVDDPMEITFSPGFGFAADAGVQGVLYAEDPGSARLDQGFNFFFTERYAEVTPEFATLTIERIEGPDGDPMAAGEPFILMIGRAGCSEFPAMPVSLIAVSFGQG